MAQIDKYLKAALTQRASDLHFSTGEPVQLRIDGDLRPIENHPPAEHEFLMHMFFEMMTQQEQERFLAQKNLDKSYMAEGIGNFRVNVFMTRRGVAAVMRTIPTKIPTIKDLGLPEICTRLCELPKGLVLVTGPTGSGKSTTLAAMLNYINENHPYHILTAEDPVEFVHPSKQCLVNQREIGTSCPTFSDALKYALREDPDVILVGEMRDLETIGLALTAAETGHLVFGTLHTRGAAASVDRIIDSFPANQQAMVRTMLSESLAAVISQALLKRASGSGRVAAYEIMVANHAVSNLIREGKTFQIQSIIQTGRREGMILMEQHVRELLQAGTVTPEEASTYVPELAGAGHSATAAPSGAPAKGGATQAHGAKPAAPSAPAPAGRTAGAKPATPPSPSNIPSSMSQKGAMPPPAPLPPAPPIEVKPPTFSPKPLKVDDASKGGPRSMPPPPPAAKATAPKLKPPVAELEELEIAIVAGNEAKEPVTATQFKTGVNEISQVTMSRPLDEEDNLRENSTIDLSASVDLTEGLEGVDQTGTFETPKLKPPPVARPGLPTPPGLKKKAG